MVFGRERDPSHWNWERMKILDPEQKELTIENRSQWNVPQIGQGSMVINHSVWEHGEMMKPAFENIRR